jgi:hypothetical protein
LTLAPEHLPENRTEKQHNSTTQHPKTPKNMNEYMMIFRVAGMDDFNPTPEELQAMVKQWQDWIGGIAAKGKFVSTNQLGFQGKTLNAAGVITDGPYAEVKEIVGGYLIAKAADHDEAMQLAQGCPIFAYGGHVEVRDIMQVNH